MKTQIVAHLLPQEIDWFEWQIKQLKIGSSLLTEDDKVLLDVTLNLNLVDWDSSSIPKQFFVDKFLQIEELCDWCETNFIVDMQNICLGCNDKRRSAIKESTSDNILYLDTDIIFRPELLKVMMEAAKRVESPYYILSPQITKLWDNSWDCLVNQDEVSLPPSQDYKKLDPFIFTAVKTMEVFSLKPIEEFKFGGGWFNLLSTKLLKLTDVPDSLGPYGLDDTYVMYCCNILARENYDIQQYVLDGCVIAENMKYRKTPYVNFLKLIDKKEEFTQRSSQHFSEELYLFSGRVSQTS